jgi:hypothetical protein
MRIRAASVLLHHKTREHPMCNNLLLMSPLCHIPIQTRRDQSTLADQWPCNRQSTAMRSPTRNLAYSSPTRLEISEIPILYPQAVFATTLNTTNSPQQHCKIANFMMRSDVDIVTVGFAACLRSKTLSATPLFSLRS